MKMTCTSFGKSQPPNTPSPIPSSMGSLSCQQAGGFPSYFSLLLLASFFMLLLGVPVRAQTTLNLSECTNCITTEFGMPHGVSTTEAALETEFASLVSGTVIWNDANGCLQTSVKSASGTWKHGNGLTFRPVTRANLLTINNFAGTVNTTIDLSGFTTIGTCDVFAQIEIVTTAAIVNGTSGATVMSAHAGAAEVSSQTSVGTIGPGGYADQNQDRNVGIVPISGSDLPIGYIGSLSTAQSTSNSAQFFLVGIWSK